jgi:glycosyltransferase involved in cell wall biosynthesis
MLLKDKHHDLLVITSDDHYDGLDAHGTVQIYKYIKEKIKINCALICTKSKKFDYIEDSYLIKDFSDLPKHKKIFVSDYNDLPFEIAQKMIEENNSIIYYCGLVHNTYTAGCSYPQEMDCDKYKYSTGCYNCKWVATINHRNNNRYDLNQEKVPILWKTIKDFFTNKRNKENIVYLPVSTFSKDQARKSFLFKEIKSHLVPLVNTTPCVSNEEDLLKHRVNQKNALFESLTNSYPKIKDIENICVWNAKDVREKRKGFDSFIDALHILKSKYMTKEEMEKTLFVCLGDPQGYQAYARAFPENINIVLTGIIDESRINNIYSAASLYCCTTYEDAGPRTVGEATSNGCPTISYDTCVATDLVSDKSGKIIPYKDVDKYAKNMSIILKLNKEQHNNMCVEAFRSYMKYYGDEHAVKCWQEALR